MQYSKLSNLTANSDLFQQELLDRSLNNLANYKESGNKVSRKSVKEIVVSTLTDLTKNDSSVDITSTVVAVLSKKHKYIKRVKYKNGEYKYYYTDDMPSHATHHAAIASLPDEEQEYMPPTDKKSLKNSLIAIKEKHPKLVKILGAAAVLGVSILATYLGTKYLGAVGGNVAAVGMTGLNFLNDKATETAMDTGLNVSIETAKEFKKDLARKKHDITANPALALGIEVATSVMLEKAIKKLMEEIKKYREKRKKLKEKSGPTVKKQRDTLTDKINKLMEKVKKQRELLKRRKEKEKKKKASKK